MKFRFSGRETCRKDGSFFLVEEKLAEKREVSFYRKRNLLKRWKFLFNGREISRKKESFYFKEKKLER